MVLRTNALYYETKWDCVLMTKRRISPQGGEAVNCHEARRPKEEEAVPIAVKTIVALSYFLISNCQTKWDCVRVAVLLVVKSLIYQFTILLLSPRQDGSNGGLIIKIVYFIN